LLLSFAHDKIAYEINCIRTLQSSRSFVILLNKPGKLNQEYSGTELTNA